MKSGPGRAPLPGIVEAMDRPADEQLNPSSDVPDERAAVDERAAGREDAAADGGAVANEGTTADEGTAADEEAPWWQDSGMPWHQKPGKRDYWCMACIGLVGVVGLAMLPLKGWLLGLRPDIMLGVSGSRIGAAATGALVAVGSAPHWWAWLLLGSLVSIKLDWVYWWAGKLWGRGMIEVWAGSSPRAQRRYDRLERWAGRLGWLGILVAYAPIPLPLMPVVFVLSGASGMKLRTFLIIDFIAATVWNLGFLLAGRAVGDPIVDLLHEYNKVVNWVTVVLLVAVLVPIFLRSGRRTAR